jgi:formylglycine-generating enzyme required for sulfatase activity
MKNRTHDLRYLAAWLALTGLPSPWPGDASAEAETASAVLSLEQRSLGRFWLVVNSSARFTFQMEYSTRLPHWIPFVQGVVSSDAPFAIETPTESPSGAFFRLRSRPDLPPLLKPMVVLPGGTFLMGQPGIAEAVHEVTLSPFKMDAHEVTKLEWDRVVAWATNAARGSNVYGFRGSPGADGLDYPIVLMDWYETVKWANARSEYEGLEPVYFTDAAQTQVYRTGVVDVRNDAVNWSGSGYRLPTEAEWEYAARGGLTEKLYPWGDDIPTSEQLNFNWQVNQTTPVGSYPPNAYGLFDMAGNVREWCWDLHRKDPSVNYTNHIVCAPYFPDPQTDPHGPDTGPRGMSRGGSWLDGKDFVQCGRRHNDERTRFTVFTGFRLVAGRP